MTSVSTFLWEWTLCSILDCSPDLMRLHNTLFYFQYTDTSFSCT